MELVFPATIHIPALTNPSSKYKNSLLLSANFTAIKSHLSISNLVHNTLFSPSGTAFSFSLSFSRGPNQSPISANASSSSSPSSATTTTLTVADAASSGNHWIVVVKKPPSDVNSKPEIINYYVETLARVLGSEKEAQMCIYDAFWRTHFGFCCDIDEQTSRQLATIPWVLSVRPDKDFDSTKKDSFSTSLLGYPTNSEGTTCQRDNSKGWHVRMEKPSVEVVTKAQMVDYYSQTLTKVMGNEKDAQVSIYKISWQNNFEFCCQIDEECARELAGVPGVLSVEPDSNLESENKDCGDGKSADLPDSSDTDQTPPVKTKRIFVTGLSFYTTEKTLRAAFEGFGELVEVKIIMDKISKRSKGYAFIEYTTEEAAGAALKEMNGKIINGWMIVVDVAKTNPPRYSRNRQRPTV